MRRYYMYVHCGQKHLGTPDRQLYQTLVLLRMFPGWAVISALNLSSGNELITVSDTTLSEVFQVRLVDEATSGHTGLTALSTWGAQALKTTSSKNNRPYSVVLLCHDVPSVWWLHVWAESAAPLKRKYIYHRLRDSSFLHHLTFCVIGESGPRTVSAQSTCCVIRWRENKVHHPLEMSAALSCLKG